MFIKKVIFKYCKQDKLFLIGLKRITTNALPPKMLAWCVPRYGTFEIMEQKEFYIPTITSPEHLLIEVHATSINPIDIAVMNGYGENLLSLLSKIDGVNKEFPLIPCHDVAGKVVATGQNVNTFNIGDEIWGTTKVHLPGALAQYTLVTQSEISLKPKTLNFVESASMPYVACTTYAALSKFAAIDKNNFFGKKILILGGSGGIGTFACQFSKSLGCEVTATCSASNIEKLLELKCDHVADYTTVNFLDQLKINQPYDIVFDAVGDTILVLETKKLLKKNMNSLYTAIVNPFISNVTQYGLVSGMLTNGFSFAREYLENLACNQIQTNWAFYDPSAHVMQIVKSFVENKSIVPVIEKVYRFDEAKNAVEKVGLKHNKGKTIVQII